MRPNRLRPLLAALLVTGLVAGCGGGDDEEATTTTEGTTTTTLPPVAPLTGQPEPDSAKRERPALVVKIDNTAKGRAAQQGIEQADVVYVEMVEGNQTRLAAIYQSNDVEAIGPVRSVRTTDLSIMAPLNTPIFAFSGGTPVIDRVRSADLVNAGRIDESQLYEVRGSGVLRFFVSTGTMYDFGADPGGTPPQLFTYRDSPEAPGNDVVTGATVQYGRGSTVTYEAGEGAWPRSQDGGAHTSGGNRIAPTNVIIQFVEYRDSGIRDVTGAPSPEAVLVGEGSAWVLTGGKVIEGRWVRGSEGDVTQFLDASGEPIALAPGSTWIELAPQGGASLQRPEPTTTAPAGAGG